MMTPTGSFTPPALTPEEAPDTKLDLDSLLVHDETTTAATAGAQRRGPHARHPRAHRTARNRTGTMPLREHIVEFRARLIRAAIGILAMSIIGWFFADPVFRILQQPFLTAAQQQDGLMSITFTGVVSAFNVKLQISFFLGLVASCPWWSYQLWAFINPGLERRERWTAIAFIAASVPLFLVGAGLAWFFLPNAIAILTGFAPANTATLLSADVYFTFILHMTVAFGLAFLLPVVMVALTMMDVVSSGTWLRQWRIAVLLAFVFAAIATPTGDAGTLCALAVPICAIYFTAILVCWIYEKVQAARILRAMGEETRFGRMMRLARERCAALIPGRA